MSLSDNKENYQYYATIISAIASVLLGIASFILALVVFSNKTEVARMGEVISGINDQNKKEDEAIGLLSHQSVTQDSILGKTITAISNQLSQIDNQIRQINLLIESQRLLKKQNELTQAGTTTALNQLNIINKSAEQDYLAAVSSINTMCSQIIAVKEAFELDERANTITKDNYLDVYLTQIKFVEDIAKIVDPQKTNKFVLSNKSLRSAMFQFSNQRSVTLLALKVGTPLAVSKDSKANIIDSAVIANKAFYFEGYKSALREFLTTAGFAEYLEEEKLPKH